MHCPWNSGWSVSCTMTPSALLDGWVSQAEEDLKGSLVLTVQRGEMYQGLSFPDAETGVRVLWQLLKNDEHDVMYIMERGNGKELNITTTLSLWKVAPTLQEPAQHAYLPGHPKISEGASQQLRVWTIYNAHLRIFCSQILNWEPREQKSLLFNTKSAKSFCLLLTGRQTATSYSDSSWRM